MIENGKVSGVILGIDPGSRVTGFGVIAVEGAAFRYVASGFIKLEQDNINHRLQSIFSGITEVMSAHRPTSCAIEQVFMHQNPGAALKLGQARGAAIVAMMQQGAEVAEYSARQVKQSVVGYGAASKPQVQEMVCRLLRLQQAPQADAADALAIALCHAHTQKGIQGIVGVSGIREGRWR